MSESTQDSLLDPIEASHFLGITPELLFAYVRNAPKQRAGHNMRLAIVQDGPHVKFRPEDLGAFDAYLKEPWSSTANDRPPIPSYIVDYLKVEAGGQCPRCGRGFKLENAHVQDYATSRSHHHHNLIRLCSQCHDEFDDRRILPRDELTALKARLIQRTRERLEAHLYSLLQTSSRPMPAALFVGRTEEIAALLGAFGTKRRIGVRGVGGIGKTQLVLQALARLEEDAEVLWISVDGFESASTLEVALRAFGLGAGRSRFQSRKEGTLAGDVDFIVFDGVEGAGLAELERLEEVLAYAIAPSAETKIVFTSQVELHGLELDFDLELSALSELESLSVLKGSAGSNSAYFENDTSRAAWLLSFSGGHPLTLRIIGGLLGFFKSPETVVARLRASGAEQLISPTRTKQTKSSSLDVCLSVTYQSLTVEQKKILFLISHCPAGCFMAMLRWWESIAVVDLPLAVAQIARWHLISTSDRGGHVERVQMLSPIRSYIQQMFQKDMANAADELTFSLVHKLAAWACYLDIEHIQEGDVGYGMGRFTQEFANFSHVFDVAVAKSSSNVEYLEYVSMLASALQVFCFLSGLSRRGIEIMRLGADAAKRIGKPRLATDMLLQLQSLAHRVGDRDEIERSAQKIGEFAHGSDDPSVLGNVAMARGVVAKLSGNIEVAEREFIVACANYERADCLEEDLPDGAPVWVQTNDRMLAMALMERGSIYEHSARPDQALPLYQRALTLMERTHDAVNYGSVLHQMGNCYGHLGQHEVAYNSYLSAAKRFADISAAIHLSNSMSELGYELLDYFPAADLANEFPTAVLELALDDVFVECATNLGLEVTPFPDQECMRLVRKAFGVAIVVSFSPHNTLLNDFAARMQEQVLRPLLEFDGGRYRREHAVPLMHLDVTIALMGSVAGPGQTRGSIASLDEIAHLASLCYRQYDWAWKAFRLFDWLEAYLTRCRGRPAVTGATLMRSAQAAAERGMPFVTDGINS